MRCSIHWRFVCTQTTCILLLTHFQCCIVAVRPRAFPAVRQTNGRISVEFLRNNENLNNPMSWTAALICGNTLLTSNFYVLQNIAEVLINDGNLSQQSLVWIRVTVNEKDIRVNYKVVSVFCYVNCTWQILC